jgi:hypothetical protein
MAKQRKTIGTGITAREVVTYDGEDMQAALVEFFSRWNANRIKGGGDYGAVSLHIIEKCHRIVANSVRPYETDGPADFAKRILRHHQIVQAAIKRGDADAAARFAYEVGVLAAQAIMKQVWERHALRGKKNLEAVQSGSRKSNQQRHEDRAKQWQLWNTKAASIWKRSPGLFKAARRQTGQVPT